MTNREFFIRCWEQEYPAFVRVFKALPADKLDYRPHPRSRTASELVWLMVQEERSGTELAETHKIDWKEDPPTMSLDEMIVAYEQAHADLAPHLKELDDKSWDEKQAQLLFGGQVAFETTLGGMFWATIFDAVHHRGQLSVYIRPMGGKVPAIYGPSADDPGT